jgi:hypothetical protein
MYRMQFYRGLVALAFLTLWLLVWGATRLAGG